MPILELKTNANFEPETNHRLANDLRGITANILKKVAEKTVVRIENQPLWFVGTDPIPSHSSVIELSIKITKDTNTPSEKSDWISNAWRILNEHLGEIVSPSYISIIELEPQSWGYSGLTQNARGDQKHAA